MTKGIILPELLSPAGNWEKMVSAVRYGADAVYLAGQDFGMRSAADNFTSEQLRDAIIFCHKNKKKLYLTVNTLPRWNEIEPLREYMREIASFPEKPDALIIADLGVMTEAKKILPEVDIHISTQAGVVNHADAEAWHALGASRVVLARELSLEDIKRIRERIPYEIELETFVHGSMCVSFSGRCLLSNHFTGRDANRGMCAQPCRWKFNLYSVVEETRPDEHLPVYETDRGTFIMSSKDMNMIRHIPELCGAGISSLKIEGRMKSAYYTAVTANAYRMALDAFRDGKEFNDKWESELDSVSHRSYCTGYFFSDPMTNAQVCNEDELKTGYIREKTYCAIVHSYDKEKKLALCVQKNKMRLGDDVEYITPGEPGRGMKVEKLFDKDMVPIESTPHAQMEFYMYSSDELKEGDIIRK